MNTPTDDSSPGGAEPNCPKCGADRASGDELCPTCGIVFAKWYARQAGATPVAPRATRSPTKRWLLPVTITVAVLAIGIALTYERTGLVPALRGDDVIVTFEDGSKCRLANWRFRYVRHYSQSQGRGNVLIVGRPLTESRFDSTLRVFDPLDQKIAITPDDLRSIELTLRTDPENSFKRRVSSLTITTASDSQHFEPHEIHKYSRTRVLVPDAAHYYPDHYDDDYMGWASSFVYLVGEPTPECGGHHSFNLTNDEFRKPWTPIHFDFPG